MLSSKRIKVYVISETDEVDLVTGINKFGDEHKVIATQTHQTPKGWTAFLFYEIEE